MLKHIQSLRTSGFL